MDVEVVCSVIGATFVLVALVRMLVVAPTMCVIATVVGAITAVVLTVVVPVADVR
jgi:hypothetical protein